KMGFGIAFYGEHGTVLVDARSWRIEDPDGNVKPFESAPVSGSTAPHIQNFLDCVKSREKPNADIEIGHTSTRLCHLRNIAYRVGRRLAFEGATESSPGDAEANRLLSREYSRRFEMPSQV